MPVSVCLIDVPGSESVLGHSMELLCVSCSCLITLHSFVKQAEKQQDQEKEINIAEERNKMKQAIEEECKAAEEKAKEKRTKEEERKARVQVGKEEQVIKQGRAMSWEGKSDVQVLPLSASSFVPLSFKVTNNAICRQIRSPNPRAAPCASSTTESPAANRGACAGNDCFFLSC